MHNDEKEIWKIIEHPNIIKPNTYAISNKGNIQNIVTGYMMKRFINRTGYYYVILPTILKDDEGNVKAKHFTIHSLVHFQFTNEPQKIYDKRFVINHIDGVKLNCDYTNLEWCTQKENMIHASRTGLMKSGEDKPNAKVTNDEVHAICKMLEQEISCDEILDTLGFEKDKYHRTLVANIKTGAIWKKISGQYDIKSGWNHMYSEEEMHNICRALQEGWKPQKIYDAYGHTEHPKCSFESMLKNIKAGTIYKDISSQYELKYGWDRKYSDEEVHKICKMLEQGYMYREIYNECAHEDYDYPRFKSVIANIKSGRLYRDISSQYNIKYYGSC